MAVFLTILNTHLHAFFKFSTVSRVTGGDPIVYKMGVIMLYMHKLQEVADLIRQVILLSRFKKGK